MTLTTWLLHVESAATRGSVALLLAWAVSLLPGIPAAVRCWAWRAAYAVLIVAFIWTTPIELPVRRAETIPQQQSRGVSPRSFAAQGSFPSPRPSPTNDTGPTRPGSAPDPAPLREPPRWPTILFTAYLAFLAAYAARLTLGWFRARRLRRGVPVNVAELPALARRFGVRPPPVLTHPAARSPLLVGVFHPLIVLPPPQLREAHGAAVGLHATPTAAPWASRTQYPSGTANPALELILAHELAHLARHDLLWNWLPTIASALLPIHPLLWIGHRRHRLAVESAADALALTTTQAKPADYGRLLVTVATRPAAGVLALAAAAESRWILKQRLSAMAHATHWNRRRLATARTLLAVVTAATAVPWRAVAQPPTTSPVVLVPPASPKAAPATTPTVAAPSKETPEFLMATVVVPSSILKATHDATVLEAPLSVGQTVKRGDLLVRFSAGNADAELDKARAELEFATTDLERKGKLFKQGTLSTSEMELARSQSFVAKARMAEAQNDVDASRLLCPYNAVVATCDVQPGDTVTSTQALLTLLRDGPPQLRIDVPQDLVARVRVGTTLTTLSNHGGETATVISVAPMVDPMTQSQRVIAQMSRAEPWLLSGMHITLQFTPTLEAAAPPPPRWAPGNVTVPPGGTLTAEGRDGSSVVITDGVGKISAGRVVVKSTDGALYVPNDFPFTVPFEVGATKFAPGDKITITDVHGTAADIANGIYRITGTYTLASQESATLGASVTAANRDEGVSPVNRAANLQVKRGSGPFTLMLPVSIHGWPHLSFTGTGESFGNLYFGTGDTVLRK